MERIVKGIWIPIEIWQNNSLSWNERILLMEIDSYTNADIDCHLSNADIAQMFGTSEVTASKYVNRLIELGFVEVSRFDGRTRFIRSRLDIDFKAGLKHTLRQTQRKSPNFKADIKETLRLPNSTDISSNNSLNINNNLLANNNLDNQEKEIVVEKKKIFDFKAEVLALGADPQNTADWIEVRKGKKARNTKSAVDGLIREAKKAGITVAEAVRICAEQSWQGFRNEYYQRLIRMQNYSQQRPQRQETELRVNDKFDPNEFPTL